MCTQLQCVDSPKKTIIVNVLYRTLVPAEKETGAMSMSNQRQERQTISQSVAATRRDEAQK